MPMTIAELKAMAEAATPGEWKAPQTYVKDLLARLLVPTDAAFIAAANPRIVAAMIEEIQAWRRWFDDYVGADRPLTMDVNGFIKAQNRTRNTRAALDAVLKETGDV